jgi:hypothetical protein
MPNLRVRTATVLVLTEGNCQYSEAPLVSAVH